MSNSIDNQINHGSVRVNTRASQPRSSSNLSFQDQFRSGLKTGIDLTNSAVRQIARPIPGSAAVSASLSEAARSLGGPSSVSGLSGSVGGSLGSSLGGSAGSGMGSGSDDMGSLQDEMYKNNNDLLDKQLRISLETTTMTTKSNLMKAYFDAAKTIGSNLR